MKRRSTIAMGLLMAVMAVTACKAGTVKAETKQQGTPLVIVDDELEQADTTSEEIRGGTNQNDAVLLPMNTKLYGKADGNGLWYAFTTGAKEDATYYITTVNKTLGTYELQLRVYDEFGTQQQNYVHEASSQGKAATFGYNLSPNITYYIYIWASRNQTTEYMLYIENPDEEYAGYNTAGNLAEARGDSAAKEGAIYPATNQDDAPIIPTNVKLSGNVSDGIGSWFAFMTNSSEDTTYKITTVNATPDTYDLLMCVYDKYGTRVHDSSHSASSDGKAATLSLSLSPDSIYYIYIWADRNQSTDYILSIKAPEEPVSPTASIEKDPLVFETPFELTETQVMFVANKALFVDEDAAQAALQPVADIILSHPDNSILLAGTTATDGTQESCVDLSNRRATAVKNVLVDSFGVPEAQLLTVGLGYEADPFVRGQDRDANGDFVETEGAKNRRVIVLDANDPIAKELLG